MLSKRDSAWGSRSLWVRRGRFAGPGLAIETDDQDRCKRPNEPSARSGGLGQARSLSDHRRPRHRRQQRYLREHEGRCRWLLRQRRACRQCRNPRARRSPARQRRPACCPARCGSRAASASDSPRSAPCIEVMRGKAPTSSNGRSRPGFHHERVRRRGGDPRRPGRPGPYPAIRSSPNAARCRAARGYVSWWWVPGAGPPRSLLSRRRIGCFRATVRASPAGCPCPARAVPVSRGRRGKPPAR
jgi:hypothetical protein